LLANFGSQTQSPIQPPNTVVPSKPDQGGGTTNDNAPHGGLHNGQGGFFGGLTFLQGIFATVGNLTDWAEELNAASSSLPVATSNQATQSGDIVAPWAVQIGPGCTGPVALDNTQAATLVISSSLVAQVTPAPVAAGPAPSVLQALDDALAQWSS